MGLFDSLYYFHQLKKSGKVDSAIKAVEEFDQQKDKIGAQLNNLEKEVALTKGRLGQIQDAVVRKSLDTKIDVDYATQHICFETVYRVIAAGCSPFLVGPAGSGKSTILAQVANAMNLGFYPMSVNALTSDYNIIGYNDANGKYVSGTIINNALGGSNSGEATLPGKIKLKDLNGDGIVDQNDKTVIGNTNPEFQGGFGLSGQWKDFDFSANFTYMIGFDVYNATAYALSSSTTSQYKFDNVLSKFADERWRYVHVNDGSRYSGECMYKNYYLDNAVETYIGMNANATTWNPADLVTKAMISNFVEDGSFVRCSDVTLGYTLPTDLTAKWGVSKLRVYASASNLFILTNYSGFDPEVDVQSGLTPSMDYNRYPRNRQFSLGVNVSF